MIILDLSQVMIANFMASVGNHASEPIDENLFRHMVLNSIRAYRVKFGITFGELVIACDDKKLWRREIFQHYKANRKKAREESDIDWASIFGVLNKVKGEIKEYFPYRVIQTEGAEADDIIGTLVHNFDDRILILSGDKDFRQLQRYPRVEQFDPVQKKYILEPNPEKQLKELIIRGDKGDGVPNVLSPDDCLVNDTRQKKIMSDKLSKWVEKSMEELESDPVIGKGFKRNRELIDLSFTPQNLRDKILDDFKSQANNKRDKIFNYLINNKCKLLVEHVNEF